MNNIDLHMGNCLDKINLIPDNSVDAIITDPPFGITSCKWDSIIPFRKYVLIQKNRKKKLVSMYRNDYILHALSEGKDYQEAIIYFEEHAIDGMFEHLNRIIKPNGAMCLFGSEPFSSSMRMSNIDQYRYDWTWKKRPTLFQHSKNRPMQASENISVFSINGWGHKSQMKGNRLDYYPQGMIDGPVKKFHGRQGGYIGARPNQLGKEYQSKTGFPSTILEYGREPGDRSFHPTQKPVALLEFLIKSYTNEGETVLDFTMGSGSTGMACAKTNRKFIGIELDPDYFEIAKNRIEQQIIISNSGE